MWQGQSKCSIAEYLYYLTYTSSYNIITHIYTWYYVHICYIFLVSVCVKFVQFLAAFPVKLGLQVQTFDKSLSHKQLSWPMPVEHGETERVVGFQVELGFSKVYAFRRENNFKKKDCVHQIMSTSWLSFASPRAQSWQHPLRAQSAAWESGRTGGLKWSNSFELGIQMNPNDLQSNGTFWNQ